jgi:hypothetical protein
MFGDLRVSGILASIQQNVLTNTDKAHHILKNDVGSMIALHTKFFSVPP